MKDMKKTSLADFNEVSEIKVFIFNPAVSTAWWNPFNLPVFFHQNLVTCRFSHLICLPLSFIAPLITVIDRKEWVHHHSHPGIMGKLALLVLWSQLIRKYFLVAPLANTLLVILKLFSGRDGVIMSITDIRLTIYSQSASIVGIFPVVLFYKETIFLLTFVTRAG